VTQEQLTLLPIISYIHSSNHSWQNKAHLVKLSSRNEWIQWSFQNILFTTLLFLSLEIFQFFSWKLFFYFFFLFEMNKWRPWKNIAQLNFQLVTNENNPYNQKEKNLRNNSISSPYHTKRPEWPPKYINTQSYPSTIEVFFH